MYVIIDLSDPKVIIDTIMVNIPSTYKDNITQMIMHINNKDNTQKNITPDYIPFYLYNLDKFNDDNIIEYMKSHNYNLLNLKNHIKNLNNLIDNYNIAFKSEYNPYDYRMYIINDIIKFCEIHTNKIQEYIDNYYN